ncbi:hypothetical protein ANCCAN_25746 [Ancylostoma caninum]|uniref:GOLD domain-containing protein n=1 Tax=Ancylostoma caninum TaxID=29170 RepID=A0A368F8T5_ANCCA|nr:hypothetical protein ANCCAN_25746 [Ancylostoma caninum]
MRLTSPSGQFSDWANGEDEVTMSHNVTENGDYEICLSTPSPLTVTLSIFFRDPEKMEKAMDRYLEAHQIRGNLKKVVSAMMMRFVKIYTSIRLYNKVSFRDEAMQQSNSFYIKTYVITFCLTNIAVAFIQVVLYHRMFFVDPKRMRV